MLLEVLTNNTARLMAYVHEGVVHHVQDPKRYSWQELIIKMPINCYFIVVLDDGVQPYVCGDLSNSKMNQGANGEMSMEIGAYTRHDTLDAAVMAAVLFDSQVNKGDL